MKLAMVQMLVEPGRKEANLDRAGQRIAEAAARGAEFVVLPEAMPLGWTHPSSQELADEIPDGESCVRLCASARAHHVMVCAGVVEREGARVFNSAVLIDHRGIVLLKHRKIYELDIAAPLYRRGDRANVVDTSFGRIGVMICADGFAPGHAISRALGLMGARMIVSPCAWAVPADHDNGKNPYGSLWIDCYGPVCREFGIWIAGVSNVGPIPAGPWAGRRCIGNSLLVNPMGEISARGSYGESADEMIIVEVPMPGVGKGTGQ